MPKTIPTSNKKAEQWNNFLLYYNDAAKKELPKVEGQPDYSLLDVNKPFGTYQGGQDFYKKKFAEYSTQQGWTGQDDLTEADFPTMQQLYRQIYSDTQADQTPYKDNFTTKTNMLLSNYGGDATTFNPEKSATGKDNSEGWVGRDSRFFFIPMIDGTLSSKSTGKVIHAPESFNEGETTTDSQGNTVPLYSKNPGPAGGVFYEYEMGGKMKMEKGGELSADKAKLILKDGTIRGKKISDKQRKFFGAVASGYINKTGSKFSCGGKMYEVGGPLPETEAIAASKKLIADNNKLDFVNRITYPNVIDPIKNEDGSTSTHKMAWATNDDGAIIYPTIVNQGGKLVELSDDEAYNYAIKTGEFIKAPDTKTAAYFADGGYKIAAGWNDAETKSKNSKELKEIGTPISKKDIMEEVQRNGGWSYWKGGKMCYDDGGEVEYEEDDIEAVSGGELEKISEDVVEVEGKDHDDGGVKLNTGHEVEGGELINTKDKIVISTTLIDPETGKVFSDGYEKKAKQLGSLEREFKNSKEKYIGRKIEKLKAEMQEIYNRQQSLNGNSQGEKKELGGEVGPPWRVFQKSDGTKVKYDVKDESKISLFQSANPDAKELKLVGGQFIEATEPLATVGQKKNKLGSGAENTNQQSKTEFVPTTKLDLIKENLHPEVVDKPDNLVVIEDADLGKFKEQDKKIDEYSKKYQNDYNKIIEPRIDLNRQESIDGLIDPLDITTPDDYINDEDIRLAEIGARKARDNDNAIVIDAAVKELAKNKEKIFEHAFNKAQGQGVTRENIQDTDIFKNEVDNLLNGYKGFKFKRADGSEFNTDNVTESQQQEIRQGIVNSFQFISTFDEKAKTVQKNIEQALDPNIDFSNPNEVDPGILEMKKLIDNGEILPISPDKWSEYGATVNKIADKYAPLVANYTTAIQDENKAIKLEYEDAVAKFTIAEEPNAIKYKTELETKLANKEITEDQANGLWDVYKQDVANRESKIFEKYNGKLNYGSQKSLQDLNDSMNKEIADAVKGTIFEKIGIENINKEYVDKSINAFVGKVTGETNTTLENNQIWLQNQQQKIYNSKDFFSKFQIENIRGGLSVAEGVSGFMSFMGNYEAGNKINDALAEFAVENPTYEGLKGGFEINKLIDPDYWIGIVGPMLGQQVVFAPLSITGAGVGAQAAGRLGVGVLGSRLLQGLGSAIATRPLNSVINSGMYYNDLVESGMSTEKAALETANDFTFQMALGISDIFQMSFAFGPLGNMGLFTNGVSKVVGGAVTEGVEEVMESYPEQALSENPQNTIVGFATSDAGLDNFMGGVMGGFVMGGAFAAGDIASVKSNNSKKFAEGVVLDMMQGPDLGKRYQDLLLTIDTLKERGQLSPKQYNNAKNTLDFVYSKGKDIPVNLPQPIRKAMLGVLSDIAVLEREKSQMSPDNETAIKGHESLIKEKQKEYQVLMAGKEPMYFIGQVSYTKDDFNALMEDPEVFNQVITGTTTIGVYNDDKTLETINLKIDETNQNRAGTPNPVIEERTDNQEQLDNGTGPTEDAQVTEVTDESGSEEDIVEEDFQLDESSESVPVEGPTQLDKHLDDVTLYAQENKIELSSDEIEEVAAVLNNNPDLNIQSIIDEVKSPILYETDNGRYQYVKTEEGIKMLDSKGNEAKLSSKQKALYDKEFGQNGKLSQEEEQILDEYFKEESLESAEGSKDDAIADLLKSGITTTNFESISDKKMLEDAKKKGKKSVYLNDKAAPIDDRIDEINEMYFNGQPEVTMDDVADFIRRNPEGLTKREKSLSQKAANLAITFKEKTGVSVENFRNRKPIVKKTEEIKKEVAPVGDKKDESGIIPPVVETPIVEEKEPPEGKESKFNKTIQNSKKVSEENKKEKILYKVKSVKELSDNANKAWKEIKNATTNTEDAVKFAEETIKSKEWKGDPSEEAALAGIVAKELFELRQNPENTIEQIEDYDRRAKELLTLVSKSLTKSGQFVSRVGKFMAEILMAYPEGVTQHVQETIDELNDGSVPVNETTVKTVKEIFEELLNSEDGKKMLKDYAIREGLIKQKYKSRKEAVDAYIDAAFSTKGDGMLMSTFLPITPEVKKAISETLKFITKTTANVTLSVAEKVELAMQKLKAKIGEGFDEARLRATMQHVLENAEKFADDWQKQTPNGNVVKDIKEKIEEEYQKRAKAVQKRLEKENELKDENAEVKEINEAVSERLEAERKMREFEEGLKQLNGDKLRTLVAKVAKDFINGKGNFTAEEIKRGIQQVNGGFGLSQRQMTIIDQNAKIILDINKQLKDNQNLSQQQIIKLNYKALQASSQIMKMLTKRNWLDLLHGMKIAGYFTAKTLESNIVSNFVSKLFNKGRDAVTSPLELLFEPGTTRKGSYGERVKARLNEKFGKKAIETQKEEFKTISTAIGIAMDIMKQGTPHGDIGMVPSQYDLKPLEAWRSWSEKVSNNPKMLSKVNEAGKILLEGTLGFYSTFVLRNLGAGDAAFRIPELSAIQNRMANYLGVPLNMFLTDDQFKEWREDAEELSKHTVFQQDNILNWMGLQGTKILSKNKYTDMARRTMSLLLTSSVMPFTKTPVNLVSEVLRLIPGFAIPQLIYHTAQSYNQSLSESKRHYNQKLAQKNLKYVAISIPLFMAVKALIESGIISFPAPPDRERNAKKRSIYLNYAGSKGKMEINVPGMKKVSFDVQKFGPMGMYMVMVNAAINDKESAKWYEMIGKMFESAPSTLMENTFFTGINQLLKSFEEENYKKIWMDLFGPNTNILLPNIMADVTRLSDNDKYTRLLKDDSFWKEFYNRNIRNKIGFLPVKGVEIEGLKPKYNLWGEPIKTDVEGQPDWFHYMFDFTRSEDVDPETKEHFFIYKNFVKSKDTDWIPPMATKEFKTDYMEEGVKKELKVKLSEDLLNEYQRILGRAESEAINELWDNKGYWSDGQVEPTLKQVTKAYNKAQEKAKKEFYTEYQQQLEKLQKEKK